MCRHESYIVWHTRANYMYKVMYSTILITKESGSSRRCMTPSTSSFLHCITLFSSLHKTNSSDICLCYSWVVILCNPCCRIGTNSAVTSYLRAVFHGVKHDICLFFSTEIHFPGYLLSRKFTIVWKASWNIDSCLAPSVYPPLAIIIQLYYIFQESWAKGGKSCHNPDNAYNTITVQEYLQEKQHSSCFSIYIYY